MDVGDWFAPECADDTDDPKQLGLIQHAGDWHTPDEVQEFITALQAMVDAAKNA